MTDFPWTLAIGGLCLFGIFALVLILPTQSSEEKKEETPVGGSDGTDLIAAAVVVSDVDFWDGFGDDYDFMGF